MKRGELVTAVSSGDYGKPRPAVIVQADIHADHPSVTVLPLTTTLHDAPLFRITVEPGKETGLRRRSQVMIDEPPRSLAPRSGGASGNSTKRQWCGSRRRWRPFWKSIRGGRQTLEPRVHPRRAEYLRSRQRGRVNNLLQPARRTGSVPRNRAIASPAAAPPRDDLLAIRHATEVLLDAAARASSASGAYRTRAEAFLVIGRAGDALADARIALAIDPTGARAMAARDKAAALAARPQVVVAAPIGDVSGPLNVHILAKAQAVAARNRAAFAAHQAQEAQYEAAKAAIAADAKAANDAYAAALAAHQTEVDALDQRHAAAMADWEARVKACKAGDRTQCAKPRGRGAEAGRLVALSRR